MLRVVSDSGMGEMRGCIEEWGCSLSWEAGKEGEKVPLHPLSFQREEKVTGGALVSAPLPMCDCDCGEKRLSSPLICT